MCFREKTAWSSLVTTIVVFVPYFAYVFGLFEWKVRETGSLFGSILGAFIVAVVLQVLMQIVAQIVFVAQAKEEPKDERDRAIESKSYKIAYLVLVSAVGIVAFSPMSYLWFPTFFGQLLLSAFILAETAKYLTLAVCYRRGS